MKKYLFVVLAVIGVFSISACGGVYHSNLDTTDPNVIGYNGTAIGILPPPGPNDLARANLINSQALINRAVAQQISQSQKNQTGEIDLSEKTGMYVGVIINIDARKSVWVMHPEMDEQRLLEPGESTFYFVHSIPKFIYVHYEKRRTERRKVWKVSKFYNGIKINFGARIVS